jgi:hypothetical protein
VLLASLSTTDTKSFLTKRLDVHVVLSQGAAADIRTYAKRLIHEN